MSEIILLITKVLRIPAFVEQYLVNEVLYTLYNNELNKTMTSDKPLTDTCCLLQKFPGKGGWTYAVIPEIEPNRNNPFGWFKVRGFIDNFELIQHKLMPMGNGCLFLPVRAEIRKKIRKEAGDYVHVKLYPDESVFILPDEIIDCFKCETKDIFENFTALSEGQQKAYIDWVYKAKTEDTKAERIARMMTRLKKKMKLYDSDKEG